MLNISVHDIKDKHMVDSRQSKARVMVTATRTDLAVFQPTKYRDPCHLSPVASTRARGPGKIKSSRPLNLPRSVPAAIVRVQYLLCMKPNPVGANGGQKECNESGLVRHCRSLSMVSTFIACPETTSLDISISWNHGKYRKPYGEKRGRLCSLPQVRTNESVR